MKYCGMVPEQIHTCLWISCAARSLVTCCCRQLSRINSPNSLVAASVLWGFSASSHLLIVVVEFHSSVYRHTGLWEHSVVTLYCRQLISHICNWLIHVLRKIHAIVVVADWYFLSNDCDRSMSADNIGQLLQIIWSGVSLHVLYAVWLIVSFDPLRLADPGRGTCLFFPLQVKDNGGERQTAGRRHLIQQHWH